MSKGKIVVMEAFNIERGKVAEIAAHVELSPGVVWVEALVSGPGGALASDELMAEIDEWMATDDGIAAMTGLLVRTLRSAADDIESGAADVVREGDLPLAQALAILEAPANPQA